MSSPLFERGDLVSLSRAQVSRLDILQAPGGPGEAYTVELPINPPATRVFTFTSQGGETVADVAFELVQILFRDQTHYSVAVGPEDRQITIVGPRGEAYVVVVSAQQVVTLLEPAVQALDGEGVPIGTLRVVEPASTSVQLRQYATRFPDGRVVLHDRPLLRELDSSRTLEVERAQILSRVDPTTPLPFRPGPDGGLAIEARGGWQAAYVCNQATPATWPAMPQHGGTPMDLPLAAGAVELFQPTPGVRPEGVGTPRVDKGILGATAAIQYGQGLPAGPSNLVDVSALPVAHQRYVCLVPGSHPADTVVLGEAAEAAQDLSCRVLLPPLVAAPTWRVRAQDTGGAYSADLPIPPGLLGRYWLVDVTLVPGAPGQLQLMVNGIDFTPQIPASVNPVLAFATPPAISLLNTAAGAAGALGATLVFAGFAWRAAALSFQDHLDDAAACGLLP